MMSPEAQRRKARPRRSAPTMASLQLSCALRSRRIDLLPGLIRIEQVDALGDAFGARSEILLVDSTGMIDQEGHDARISVLGGVCDQREAADHLVLDDVIQSS